MKPRPNQFSLRRLLIAFIWFSVGFSLMGPFIEDGGVIRRSYVGTILGIVMLELPFFGAGIGALFGDTMVGGIVGFAATLAIGFAAMFIVGFFRVPL